MIGTLNQKDRAVTIVGGGAAGMFAAYFLDQAGYEVSLYEAAARLGGMLDTQQTSLGLVETAANSLVASPALYQIADSIGVTLEPVHPSSKTKYILHRGQLCRNPLTPWEILSLAYGVFLKRAPEGAETMREFAQMQFGTKVADYLVEPMITGIYGSKASEIAVAAAFPRMITPKGCTPYRAMKRNSRHLAHRGKRAIVAPVGGMGAFLTALQRHLEYRLGSRLHLDTPVNRLPESGNLMLCTPAHMTAKLLQIESPVLSERLARVAYTPMISAGVFVKETQLPRPFKGLGVLIPPKERHQVLGILFTSSCFAKRTADPNTALFTVMLGGGHHPELVEKTDAELHQLITKEMQSILQLQGEPSQIRLNRWPCGIPLYSSDLLDVWKVAQTCWANQPGRILFGNYTGEVSLRGMVDRAHVLAQNLPLN